MVNIRFFYEEESRFWSVYLREDEDDEWLVAFIHDSGDAVYLDPADKHNPELRQAILKKQYELVLGEKEPHRSKFTFGKFENAFAVSKKWDFQQALAIFAGECNIPIGTKISYSSKYVIHRAGIKDGQCCVTWWLEDQEAKKGSCPVWLFTVGSGTAELIV